MSVLTRLPSPVAYEVVRHGLVGPDGLGARLEQEDRATGVDRPLDVLRTPVVLLDELRHPGDLLDLDRAQAVGRGAGGDDVEHHLVHEVVVGRDLAADDRLAHARSRLDGDLRPVAVGRVERHRHTRRARRHHALDRDRHQRLVDVLVAAVGQRPAGVHRPPAALDVADHLVGARDPQVRVVLPGARGVGRVLGRRARAHRDRDVVAQRLVGGADLRPRARGRWRTRSW